MNIKLSLVIIILNSKLLLNARERSLDNQKMLSYLHICRRELYHSAQGFVATNRASNDSFSTIESLELVRFFSSNYIAMSVIEIGRIDEVVRHNRLSSSPRPLNLILLIESAAGVESYARVTRRCDMRGHNVLLYFRRRSDYCREPRADNRLNLEFDSLVLAWCHEARVLQEWYSVFAGRTKVKDFIGWDATSRTLRLLKDFQIYRRRDSLDGKILRVSEIQDLIGTHKNISYHREIMRNIAESINFTARFATRRIGGKLDRKLQKLTGIMGELIRNETDIGMAMFMTPKRAEFFSFTVPVLRSETTFLIKNAFDSRLSPSMYYKNHYLLGGFVRDVAGSVRPDAERQEKLQAVPLRQLLRRLGHLHAGKPKRYIYVIARSSTIRRQLNNFLFRKISKLIDENRVLVAERLLLYLHIGLHGATVQLYYRVRRRETHQLARRAYGPAVVQNCLSEKFRLPEFAARMRSAQKSRIFHGGHAVELQGSDAALRSVGDLQEHRHQYRSDFSQERSLHGHIQLPEEPEEMSLHEDDDYQIDDDTKSFQDESLPLCGYPYNRKKNSRCLKIYIGIKNLKSYSPPFTLPRSPARRVIFVPLFHQKKKKKKKESNVYLPCLGDSLSSSVGLGEPPILYDAIVDCRIPFFQSRLLRGHTLLASPPELDIFFRTRCLVPSCECGSRFCRRWQVPNLLCRLHLVSVVLASGATL
ncbi:unnamed protein product [Trichogramma brassicae]|uniref:Ionotropic glutamate receptor L-glutamate and glycine-binding domain-containing protein n=1 Tax=Trichogramma brassicae TaxID=86971 RepID=A0A6H5IYN6_9HYME|nr:unnamed protein product [Trichogramma brassicae]